MNQTERRVYLINYLLSEGGYIDKIPEDEYSQRRLLRSLMNVRSPKPISSDFLSVQDKYLSELNNQKGITDVASLTYNDDMAIWKGDITTLNADGIVNAANSAMLGCFCPCHGCIDNAIHTYAGIELRLECARIMNEQGHPEKTGNAKITPAYNLPSKYVLHTVGPIVYGSLTEKEEKELESSYLSCLKLADENNLRTLAFCCISTGEFRFPNKRAAEIAVKTVKDYKNKTGSKIKIIFNVFKEEDYAEYKRLL